MIDIYSAFELQAGLYRIRESHDPASSHGVMMYLTIGSDKAALIDTGFGVTDTLSSFIETLTRKPVICIVAHGHPDHAGAAALFDNVLMNSRDEDLLSVSLSYERRMGDVFGHGEYDIDDITYCEKHIVITDKLNYRPIDHGDVVDLGDKKLEVFSIPGHTQGSIALLDRQGGYALVSDAFSFRTALVNQPAEKSVGLINYRDGIARFLDGIDDDTLLWWGHGDKPLNHSIPIDMMKACQEVLDGKTENDVICDNHFSRRWSAAGKKMTEHKCGCVTLVYDANKR